MGTEEVTAAVTASGKDQPPEPPRKLEPWEEVGMTKATWDALEIPTFLRRGHPECVVGTTTPAPPRTPARPVTAPPVNASVGGPTGTAPSKPPVPTGLTGDFSQFRVDPEEIERKIRQEADRRWRQWTAPQYEAGKPASYYKRPRLSTFLKQVRKEFY